MDRLMAAMQQRMAAMDAGTAQPRWGVVQSVDPARHLVRVTLQPEGVLTGWLPLLAMNVGNGVGVLSLPVPGQQAFLVPDNGDAGHGVVVGLGFSTQAMPPKTQTRPASGQWSGGGATTNAQPGETIITAPGGATLRVLSDGSIYMQAAVYLQGDLHVEGDVYDRHGSLDRLRQHYDAHAHTNVQNGGGTTGPTTQPDPE